MSAKQAEKHLAKADPVMAELIKKHGPFQLDLKTDYYYALVSSIVGQQLSVKAATSIRNRFLELFGGKLPLPQQILKTEPETLRSVGFSRAKAEYIRSLAEHIQNGELELDKLPKLNNDKIIEELVAVKGIGEWTAHMFLIFALGRLDILPTGDLGVRVAIGNHYMNGKTLTPTEVVQIAEENHWAPYQSVAAWYLWRSLDNEP